MGQSNGNTPGQKTAYQELSDRIRNEVPVEQALRLWGYDTSHNSSNFYYSPFSRGERTPSFHVKRGKDGVMNVWRDFSANRGGYGVIDLGIALTGRSAGAVIEELAPLVGVDYQFTVATLDDPSERRGADHGGMVGKTVTEEPEFFHRKLLEYAETQRRIPQRVLKAYCSLVREELRYEDGTVSKHYKIGFPNRSGGWALRDAGSTRYSKITYGQADITFIDSGGTFRTDDIAPSSDRLVVFEGFMNFLSWIAWRNENVIASGRGEWDLAPGCDVVVLNSVSNRGHAAELLSGYAEVHLYLDNDSSGLEAAVALAERRFADRGVTVDYTGADVERVRAMARGSVEEAEVRERGRIAAGDASHVFTGREEKAVEAARMAAVERFNIGSRTKALGPMALEGFLESLTPENLGRVATLHNLRPFTDRIIGGRISSTVRNGLLVAGPLATAAGIHSFAYQMYGGHNDLNDAWRERCYRRMEEEVERNVASLEARRDAPAVDDVAEGEAPAQAQESLADALERMAGVAEASAPVARDGDIPINKEFESNNIDMSEIENRTAAVQPQQTSAAAENAALTGSQAPQGSEEQRKEEAVKSPEDRQPGKKVIAFTPRPYEPSEKDLQMLRALDWETVMSQLGLRVAENRLAGETRERWVERNREIFIDECRRNGPGVIEPMVRGGLTAYPVRVDLKLGSVGSIRFWSLINFRSNMGDTSRLNCALHPVDGVNYRTEKVTDGAGNFLYQRYTIESIDSKEVPDGHIYRYGDGNMRFSREQSDELRETGRLSVPVDGKTLKSLKSYTDDETGETYRLDADGDLYCGDEKVGEWKNATHICTNSWDPKFTQGMLVSVVEECLKCNPVVMLRPDGERYELNRSEINSLVSGEDMMIRIDGEEKFVHYDLNAGAVCEGRTYEQVRRERIRQGRIEQQHKSVSKGLEQGQGQGVANGTGLSKG